MTDEGLGGIDAHIANDRPEALEARLRVSLYRDFEHRVEEVSEPLVLAPHAQATRNIESLLGRFVDVSWAYRFGPPAQDLIVASIEREAEGPTGPISRAFHLPVARPAGVEPLTRLDLDAGVERRRGEAVRLSLESRRFVYGLRIHAPGLVPDDDAFSLEPGVTRTVDLRPCGREGAGSAIGLTALNMQGRLTVPLAEAAPG
jgi:beta-mannosidase